MCRARCEDYDVCSREVWHALLFFFYIYTLDYKMFLILSIYSNFLQEHLYYVYSRQKRKLNRNLRKSFAFIFRRYLLIPFILQVDLQIENTPCQDVCSSGFKTSKWYDGNSNTFCFVWERLSRVLLKNWNFKVSYCYTLYCLQETFWITYNTCTLIFC